MRRVSRLFVTTVIVSALLAPPAFAARSVDGGRRERPSLTQVIKNLLHKVMGDEMAEPRP